MVYNRLYSPSWQQHKQKEQQETRLVTKLAKTKPFPVEIYRSINLCDPWNASPPTADKDSVNQLYLVPPNCCYSMSFFADQRGQPDKFPRKPF